MTTPSTDHARIGLGPVTRITDDVALIAHQLGAPYVGLWPSRWVEERPGAGARWTVAELEDARRRCEERGLVLEYIGPHNYIRAMLGLPGGDDQIEQCIETIRAMGATGIRVLDYFWSPNGAWRTAGDIALRPGATTNGFDMAEVERAGHVLRHRMRGETGPYTDSYAQVFELADDVIVTEEDLWKTYERFLRAVLPEAEKAGVLLSVHPSDPPAPMLGGIGRMLRSPDHYRRAMALADSPSWGVLACLGSISEMPGGAANVFEMIDTFGPLGKLGLIHFRDVEGSYPTFRETFLGEGNYDPFLVMRRLLEVGYTGVIVEDHYPIFAGDSGTPDGVLPNVRAKAHAIGTLQGLLRAARTSLEEGRLPAAVA